MVYIVYRVAVYIFEISRRRDVDITRLFFKTATKLQLFFETCKKKRQILLKNAVLTYLGVIFLKIRYLLQFLTHYGVNLVANTDEKLSGADKFVVYSR